jgi:hypothetical protein
MRQLLYVSVATRLCDEEDLSAILKRSIDNNTIDSVTGVLWSDRRRFIQVLEGPTASVLEIYRRIANDHRHYDLVVVHNDLVAEREFGSWAMSYRRSYESESEYRAKIERLFARSHGLIRSQFRDFIGDPSTLG